MASARPARSSRRFGRVQCIALLSSALIQLHIPRLISNERRAQAESRQSDEQPSRNALHALPQRVEAPRPTSGMIVVNVERGAVGGVECDTVDGRELHSKLGSNAHFTDWIKDRIRQLKIVKNQDFGNFSEISDKPGRPPVGYTLTLNAAKKIAMAEHTDAGNAVRNYFLDRERISYEAPASSSDIESRFERLESRVFDPFQPVQSAAFARPDRY